MHLTSIKLAGFKSFVDSTTVALDPAVSVIVGPNGCGKSNILDAVRWAIGESAAQRLRGDINRDFIFSGSDTRPAASRASVELVFDNQDGRIGGDYASYSELAVRREVHSGEQSKSDYFLNGQRCRRNDVRDVFLGTGFGTRGYSIIQQDWITQLVNSDPETLREHLEEASGVSRYRARRHETFNKLNLTNQNLAQVRLKQDELAREIRQLKTQATRARRHVEVTQSLNRLKAQLLNRKLQFKQREQQTVLSKLGSVEDAIAKLDLRNTEFSNEQDRLESLLSAQQDEQADVAESRIEARTLVNSVVHRIEQLESARSTATANIQLKCDQLSDSLHTLESDGSELMALESDLDTIQATLNDLKNDKQNADRDLGLARRNLDAANARMETLSERESALAMQIAELEAKLQINQAAIENLADLLDVVETPDVEIDNLDDELKDADAKVAVGKQAESELLEHLSKVAQSIESDTQKRRDIVVTVEERGRELQKLRDEHLSLRTLQEASLGQEAMTVELEQWLATAKLEPGTPIGAMLQVESGWESAVEVVLGAKIRAIATSQFKNHRNHLKSLSESDVALFDIETEPNRLTESDVRPSLASKFQGPYAMQLAPLVKGIYTCDSYSEATYLVERLGEDESIVTADGAWFGKDWVRLFRSEDRASGVIERARRSNELASKISDMEKEISDLHGQQERIDREIDDAVTAREISQRKLNDVSAQLVENRTLVTQFTKLRDEKLKAQVAQQQSSDDRRADINRLRKAVEATVGKLDAQKKEQALIQREIEESQSTARRVESIFEERQESFDTVIERILTAKQDQTQCLIKVDSSERSQARQEVVVNRLVADLSSLISQGEEAKSELPGLTTKRDEGQEALTRIEQELSTKSRILRETQQELATVRKSRVGLTNEKDELTDTLSEHKSQQTRLSIEIEQLDSDLSELNTPPDDADGESELEVEEIELKIAESTARLERLGLINYRATTDLEDRVVEKEQLDEQVLDLETTMGEIQKAIERIDTETKRNLRDTFDAVNGNLARLFAALFAGGTASLEFTEEDILQAGVIVRARPPGKRNSTINMLSGGERAMTAIAFVFALFELNPSPVCILDEVDAPLDERNVVKFVELLAQLSSETQFVVITHNPATMELAGNLLGVTMEEPGVSRLVAVNLEDAYALAAQQ